MPITLFSLLFLDVRGSVCVVRFYGACLKHIHHELRWPIRVYNKRSKFCRSRAPSFPSSITRTMTNRGSKATAGQEHLSVSLGFFLLLARSSRSSTLFVFYLHRASSCSRIPSYTQAFACEATTRSRGKRPRPGPLSTIYIC